MVGGPEDSLPVLRQVMREELALFFGIDPEDSESRRSARDTWNFLSALHHESRARQARRAVMGSEVLKGGIGALIGAVVAGTLGWVALHLGAGSK